MGANIRTAILVAILCLSFTVTRSGRTLADDKNLTPGQVVSGHVKSIGSPAILAGMKSRTFTGNASVEFITGNIGLIAGQFAFVSEKQKQGIFYRYDALEYPGEHFAFDGKDVTVSYISPGRRSPLGDFLNRYDRIIKEGLMGGVLSASWALLDIDPERTKINYKKKKVDGRELHELEYRPSKGMGDIKVKLYFDLDTFGHVKTEDKVSDTQFGDIRPINKASARGQGEVRPVPDGELSASLDKDVYYVLTEEFNNFMEIDGMTLPQSYSIHYSREGRGGTFMARWTMEALQWFHNTRANQQFYRVQ